jgi:hypothetical protein
LDIPLNVNLNVNPNPGQKKLITGGTKPRAEAYTANRQPDDERSTPAKQGAGMGYDCAEQNSQANAAYNSAWKTSEKAGGQRRARPVGDAASRQPNKAKSIPTEQGVRGRSERPHCGIKRTDSPMKQGVPRPSSEGKGYDYAELRGRTNASGYDCAELRGHPCAAAYNDAWKTSTKARGAVAQRLLDQYDGLMDTKDAWGDLCEVMADGLSPEAIEQALPTRPCFSKLIARLRALTCVALTCAPIPEGRAPPG